MTEPSKATNDQSSQVERLTAAVGDALRGDEGVSGAARDELQQALRALLEARPALRAVLTTDFLAPSEQAAASAERLAEVMAEQLSASLSAHEAAKVKLEHALEHS